MREESVVLQNMDWIPFEIKKVYWIHYVPGGENRGGHAYKDLQGLVIALSGSFDVFLTRGRMKSALV
jgi:hypothetical protein